MLRLGIRALNVQFSTRKSLAKSKSHNARAKYQMQRTLATQSTSGASSGEKSSLNAAQYQETKIKNEVLEHFKRMMDSETAPNLPDDPNAFWPNRNVNIGMEFPDLTHPIDEASFEKGNFKVVPRGTENASLEDEDDDKDLDIGEDDDLPEDIPVEQPKMATVSPQATIEPPIIGEKELKRAIKAQEELPDWAKRPIAVPYLKFDKVISEKDLPASLEGFDSLGVSKSLADVLASEWNINNPTEIQKLCIPEFLKGSNILCAAQTGTGKTLSYLLPLLEKLHAQTLSKGYKRRGQRARALIIVPNRELGSQVLEVAKTLMQRDKLVRFADYTTLLLAGGSDSFKRETQSLTPGMDILVSTPERLINHLETQHLHLDDLRTVVFDEADTLMSRKDATEKTLQFISFVKESIRQKITLNRVQHVFVSATVSKPLMDLLKREYRDTVSVVSSAIHKSVPQLKQDFLYGAGGDFRFRLLLSSLQKRKVDGRVLIFCNSVQTCKDVFTRLQQKGYSVVLLHSDLDVKRRKRSFEEYMHGDTKIMVATDIASRGLDLGSKVKHVILYEFPTNTIDYLHRIGRTARAGQAGLVTALIGRSEQRLAGLIKKTLEEGRSLADIAPTIPEKKERRRHEKEEVAEEYRAQWERSNPPPKKRKNQEDEDDDDFEDEDDDFDEDFDEKPKKKFVAKKNAAPTAASTSGKTSAKAKKSQKSETETTESGKSSRAKTGLSQIGTVLPGEQPKPISKLTKMAKLSSNLKKSSLKKKKIVKSKAKAAANTSADSE